MFDSSSRHEMIKSSPNTEEIYTLLKESKLPIKRDQLCSRFKLSSSKVRDSIRELEKMEIPIVSDGRNGFFLAKKPEDFDAWITFQTKQAMGVLNKRSRLKRLKKKMLAHLEQGDPAIQPDLFYGRQ